MKELPTYRNLGDAENVAGMYTTFMLLHFRNTPSQEVDLGSMILDFHSIPNFYVGLIDYGVLKSMRNLDRRGLRVCSAQNYM